MIIADLCSYGLLLAVGLCSCIIYKHIGYFKADLYWLKGEIDPVAWNTKRTQRECIRPQFLALYLESLIILCMSVGLIGLFG